MALGIHRNDNEGVLHSTFIRTFVLGQDQVLWEDQYLSKRFVHYTLDRHATSAQRAPKSIRSLSQSAAAGRQATAWANRIPTRLG